MQKEEQAMAGRWRVVKVGERGGTGFPPSFTLNVRDRQDYVDPWAESSILLVGSFHQGLHEAIYE